MDNKYRNIQNTKFKSDTSDIKHYDYSFSSVQGVSGDVERGVGEGISNNAIFAGGVADVGCEFGDVGKLVLLAGGPSRGDTTRGLWLVRMQKQRPSRRKRKWRMAEKTARSSFFKGGVPCLSGGEIVAVEGKQFPVAVRELLECLNEN